MLKSIYQAFAKVPISSLFPSDAGAIGLLVRNTGTVPFVPLPLKLGDANLDGFPDLLLIATSAPHGGFLGIGDKADRTPKLIFSVPCASGVVGCGPNGRGRRGWAVVTDDAAAMDAIVDANGVAFLDIDEDVGGSQLSFRAASHCCFIGYS